MTDKISPTLDDLLREVMQLRDLFHRRLVDDRAKSQAIDALREEAAFHREGFTRQILAPLLCDILSLHDRVVGQEDPMAHSVAAELEGIFVRHGVRPIEQTSEFDPAVHHCVRSEQTEDAPANAIFTVVRRGYHLNGTLIRPADVVVTAPLTVTEPPES